VDAVVGEAVVAACASLHDLLVVGQDQALLGQPIEGAVERAGSEPDTAVRQLGGLLDDPVAVQGAVQQGRQDEVGRLADRGRRSYHTTDDISIDYV
jgi:hypothetical protein